MVGLGVLDIETRTLQCQGSFPRIDYLVAAAFRRILVPSQVSDYILKIIKHHLHSDIWYSV